MSYGGGVWQSQNKVLPGTYINFQSVIKATAALSDRGVAALPLPLSWGPEGSVLEVTGSEFIKNSLKIFGYPYDAKEMLPLRELFKYARIAYLYRLAGSTAKAGCTIGGEVVATALHGGERGNSLALVVSESIDNPATFDVSLLMDGTLVEQQQGVLATDDLEPSEYVSFSPGITLSPTAGAPFTGGGDGTVTGAAHQEALDKLEAYSFNTLGCTATDDLTKRLYLEYTKRQRDEVGAKFQLVGHRIPGADYEGAISVENIAVNYPAGIPGLCEQGLIYWVTGLQAGCEVNRSATNRQYDGELRVSADYTQRQLEDAIRAGKFTLHNAGGTIRVLDDINTLVTLTDTKGEMFRSNQTIRVCDQIACDVALLFNTRYVGIVPNDASGRMSLWNDVCKLIQELERIRAVEGFDTKSLAVEQGESKKSVVCRISGLNVTGAMAKLYMAVCIM